MIARAVRRLLPSISLRSQIMMNLILFSIIPFVLLSFFINWYLRFNVEREYRNDLTSQLGMSVQGMNGELSLYVRKSGELLIGSNSLNAINGIDLKNDVERIMEFQRLMDEELARYDDGKFTLYFKNYTGLVGLYIDQFDKLQHQDEIWSHMESASIAETYWLPELKTIDRLPYLVFYRHVANLTQYDGVLEVGVPFKKLLAYLGELRSMPDGAVIVFTNRDGKRIYAERQTGASAEALEPDAPVPTRGVLTIDSNELLDGSRITVVVTSAYIFDRYKKMLWGIIGTMAALVAVSVLASGKTSRRMTRKLNDFISLVKNSDRMLMNHKQIEVTGHDEVSLIQQKFVSVLRRMNEMYSDLLNAKTVNSQLEIELLQARINPHLLYNSLSVIRWSALKQQDERSVEIIDAMTRYYRIALNKGSHIIKVFNELNMIREYVNVVSYTHATPYKLTIQADEEMLKYDILKHLLQPVVENAIVHGLNGREDAALWITGYMEREELVFQITDNGYGMSKETLESITDDTYQSAYGGYGIRNVRKRLDYYNGSKSGFTMESEPGRGTTVTIRIKINTGS